jgi:hypothetical protein
MTTDPTRPSKTTKQESRLAAGVVEEPVGARRRDRREPCCMTVQRARRVVVDAPAAAVEDASLAISRCCRSRDCRRRATLGCPYYRHCCCRSHCSYLSPSPSTSPSPCLYVIAGVGAGGGGAVVGHDGSCCGGHRGSSCCGGCPPPEGSE